MFLAFRRNGHNTDHTTTLEDAVKAEAEAHGFDETATRWLTLLLQDDPTLPAPTAGAMVARVCQLPIGADLAALDAYLATSAIRIAHLSGGACWRYGV